MLTGCFFIELQFQTLQSQRGSEPFVGALHRLKAGFTGQAAGIAATERAIAGICAYPTKRDAIWRASMRLARERKSKASSPPKA